MESRSQSYVAKEAEIEKRIDKALKRKECMLAEKKAKQIKA